MRFKKNYRTRRKLFVFVLMYALIITSYFSLHTFSKYISTTNGGTGTKGIAKWDVQLDTSTSSNVINLISGNSTNQQNYILSITSQSEVGVDCSLSVTNLPTGIQLSIDNQATFTESNNTIYVSNFSYFNANDQNSTKNYILTFIAPIDVSAISNQQIGIDVSCKQRSI